MLVIWYFKFAKQPLASPSAKYGPLFPFNFINHPFGKGGLEGDNIYGEGQVMTNDTYVR